MGVRGIDFGAMKFHAVDGTVPAYFIVAGFFASLVSFSLMTSGTLQPKVSAPTSAHST